MKYYLCYTLKKLEHKTLHIWSLNGFNYYQTLSFFLFSINNKTNLDRQWSEIIEVIKNIKQCRKVKLKQQISNWFILDKVNKLRKKEAVDCPEFEFR